MTRIDDLLEIMARLRDPADGCPWDVEQTFETIAPYTIEEAYEVDHAIQCGNMAELCDELGDLLLQVVFHAQMADEADHFAFPDVVTAICDKLVRRHPHIFASSEGPAVRRSASDQTRSWEQIKARERAAKRADGDLAQDPFDGIPTALPALSRAVKLRKRVANTRQGSPRFDADSDLSDPIRSALEAALARIGECTEAEASEREAQVGDLLASCVDLARALGVDPEQALRQANHEYEAQARAELEQEPR